MKLDKLLIPISIILAGLIIGLFFYFSASKNNNPTSVSLPTPTIFPTAAPTITPLPTADDLSAIREALAIKLGISAGNLDVSISKNTGEYAKGNVKEKTSQTGGGYYLAAKAEGKWVIVYDGQSAPTCKQLESYNFPKDMVPECLNLSGKVITR
nr:hypothetical protein [Candidatus Levybacteria bacterium]